MTTQTAQAVAPRPELSPNLKLRDIIDTLPPEVFQKDEPRAWRMVFLNVLAVIAGYAALVFSPWYLLPLAWLWTGTALTGFFVVGHDCGHRSFSNKMWVNDTLGHIMFLPLLYPFHAWRILHNHHHKHTNKLDVDNAWAPFTVDYYRGNPAVYAWGYRQIRSWFWWVGSIAHWAILHFDWTKFEGKQREQIRFSSLFVLVGGAILLPTLVYFTGFWGLVKFWLVPWLVYHFWMSTFTIVHHTIPEIPFKPEGSWHEASAQLAGTVHCDYPAWVEWLCHDINVHIPHHVSTAIPSYRLRQAHQSLVDNWGPHLHLEKFSLDLMKRVVLCQLYHPERNYQTFKEAVR